MRRRFTPDEKKFIIENHATLSNLELRSALNLEKWQLDYLVRTLGLSHTKKKHVTNDQIKFIADNIRSTTVPEICEKTGRQPRIVYYYLKKLGIEIKEIPKVRKKPEQKKIQRPPAIYDNKGHIYLINKYSEAI